MYPAILLHRAAYRESDLLCELLLEGGLCRAIARGAKRSKRRFVGALEPGALLNVELAARQKGGDFFELRSAKIERSAFVLFSDLRRFYHLTFVVEIARLTAHENLPAPGVFRLVRDYLAHLENHDALLESLLLWELAVFEELGVGLRFDRSALNGGCPDAVALGLGGAVRRDEISPDRAVTVRRASFNALAYLAELQAGAWIQCPSRLRSEVRQLFDELWFDLTGKWLKSSRFVL